MQKLGFHLRLVFWVLPVALFSAACEKDVAIPSKTFIELPQAPAHFPPKHYDNPQNPLSLEGIELGRKLFYDKNLSATGAISCGSCHKQEAAFSDPGKALSTGIHGRKGVRHSPALFNLAWHSRFHWDGGINHIEVQPIAPLQDTLEMGMPLIDVVHVVGSDQNYQKQFNRVFNTDTVTDKWILYALAQFMTAMISAEAKYDRVTQNKAVFTESEKRGQQLFDINCASCHKPPLFSDFSFRNNGLPIKNEEYGRYVITQNAADKGKFKVPSLRNIQLSPPYMHDGRFETIDEVLDHYIAFENHHPQADGDLPQNLTLTSNERTDLKKFLAALTDESFVSNPLFSDPNP